MSSRKLSILLASLLYACGAAPSTAPKPPAPEVPVPSSAAAPAEAFRAQRPAASAPGRFEFPTPQVTKLANGMTVYWVRRPTRVVSLSLIVRHGASAVPEGKSGLAALTARMLTEGTRQKTAVRLAEAIESLGATLSASTGRDESTLALTVLPADVNQGLSLLAEVVIEPAFLSREFERVRAEWLDGLRGERQNPQRLAMLAAVRALHGPNLGAPVNGTIQDVERLGVTDLRDFHQRAYAPDSAALIVVGDLEATAFHETVARQFREWRKNSRISDPPAPPVLALDRTRILLVDRPSAVQSAIVAVQAFPKRSEPGYEVREILGRVLGGLFTSRLNTNLREKNAYTYGASAIPVASRYTGTLLVVTSVRSDVTAEALSEIRRELSLVRDPSLGAPLNAQELTRARSDLVFSLGAQLEHPSRIADIVGGQFVDALPPDYHTRYAAQILGIAPEAVADAARAVTPDRLIVVIVGDRAKIAPSLEKQGFTVESAPPSLLD